MGFMEELSDNELLRLLVPIGIGIAVTVLAVLLRNFIYWRLHRWAAKTETEWDDIVIHSTRFASLLWCFVLGIYAGIEFAVVPQSWEGHIDDVVPVLFIAMGIYTGVIIVKVFLDWYMVAVAQKTASPLDDLIIGALKSIVPFDAGVLGLILMSDMSGYEVPAVNDWLNNPCLDQFFHEDQVLSSLSKRTEFKIMTAAQGKPQHLEKHPQSKGG